jgi:hypothetical protein
VSRRQRGCVRNNLQRTLTYHRLELGNHSLDAQRFGKEAAVGWSFRIWRIDLAGNQDDLDSGPAVVHRVGQFQAVHAAGHLNVGEEQRYVRTGLQNGDGFIGVDSLNRTKPRILHNVNGTHAQNHLVFDDKDVRQFG